MREIEIPTLDSPEALLGMCAGVGLLIGLALWTVAAGGRKAMSASTAQMVNRLGTEMVFMAVVVFPVGFLFLSFNPERKWEVAKGLAVIVPCWMALRIYRVWRPGAETSALPPGQSGP